MANRQRTKNMAYISLGAVILAVSAWITIPFTVPFTLQTFALFLLLNTFGGKIGMLAYLLYIALGFVGVPVFSGFNNAYAVFSGPTAGYVIGFAVTGGVYFALNKLLLVNKAVAYIMPFVSLAGCYLCAVGWYMFYFQTASNIYAAVSVCVLPYIIPDILKILLALILSPRIKKALR